MADYERVRVRPDFSANSDYSDPKQGGRTKAATATPDHVFEGEMKALTAGVDVLAADMFLSGDTVMIQNLDTTNFVVLTVKDNGGTSISVDVPAGGIFLLSGWDPSGVVNVAADTANCNIYFYISGTY